MSAAQQSRNVSLGVTGAWLGRATQIDTVLDEEAEAALISLIREIAFREMTNTAEIVR